MSTLKKTRNTLRSQSKPQPVKVEVNADTSDAILQVAKVMEGSQTAMHSSYEAMTEAFARMKEESALLNAQMTRLNAKMTQLARMEIKAGDVEVNVPPVPAPPPRAKSFRIEYDEITGQPERLIPEYETFH